MFQVKNIQRKSDDQIAHEMVNNWREFDSFAMHDKTIRESDNYAIVYTENRDSDLLTQSNAAEIDKRLKPFRSYPRMCQCSLLHHAHIGHVVGLRVMQ